MARRGTIGGAVRDCPRPKVSNPGEVQSGQQGKSDATKLDSSPKPLVERSILSSASSSEDKENVETDESLYITYTPQSTSIRSLLSPGTERSRPVTRSTKMTPYLPDTITVGMSPSASCAHQRLRDAIQNGSSATSSCLEEAKDIDFIDNVARDIAAARYRQSRGARRPEDNVKQPGESENGDLPASHDDELEKGHPTVGGLRVPRRSDRIRAKNRAAEESLASPAVLTALTTGPTDKHRVQKRPRYKRAPKQSSSLITPLRRSARLAKPLDVFHKYVALPTEIQLLIWESMIVPRLVYICNQSSQLGHALTFGVQNRIPGWFMACRLSAYVAMRQYKAMFGQLNGMSQQIPASLQPPKDHPVRAQPINPDSDIVIYEPCHSGCRACYCAQQYLREDRSEVQRMAVQMDSLHLHAWAEPGWVTVSRAWPNVRILYMMNPAVKGINQSDKAMIRIKEGAHEHHLYRAFNAWKNGVGKDSNLETLEFVRVVPQESDIKNIKDRYQAVENRKTGDITDIIFG